jgi:ubiquinone/menaquinone biosynthesis C-methylase UbiE
MTKTDHSKVCPVELSGSLDNSFRRYFQNPEKIMKPYIKPGMVVLDLGCGPGFFTIGIAKLLIGQGKVVAADLQEGMLEKIRQKISKTTLEKMIELHKCQEQLVGVTEKVDFILAFYMVHEVPDQDKLFKELKSILKPEGKIFIVEPNFHVPKKSFNYMLERIKNLGFEISIQSKSFLNRSVVLMHTKV